MIIQYKQLNKSGYDLQKTLKMKKGKHLMKALFRIATGIKKEQVMQRRNKKLEMVTHTVSYT